MGEIWAASAGPIEMKAPELNQRGQQNDDSRIARR